MENREELLYTYACEKFEQQKYDEALEAFILLYGKGYERDWIKNSIYQCYVDGNESQFKSVFELHAKGIKVNYEDCKIDFVPYKDGQYYMFDKGKSSKFYRYFFQSMILCRQNLIRY